MCLKHFLVTSFLLGAFANLHENQSCFQTGECRKGLHIDGEVLSDEFACLDFCNSNSECSWITYFPSTQYCQLYRNCPVLDTEYCADCLSSQSDCVPEDPTCFVTGECDGIVHHTQPSASAEDCLQICNSTVSCRWFTFEATASECILLETCPTIDESCETCISGERRCISTTSSTTPTSTTTELTTTTSVGKGYVAFMVGGRNRNQAEVYSPDGKCQLVLSPVPISSTQFFMPTLANIDDKIIACPSSTQDTQYCWRYSATENNWTVLTSLQYQHLEDTGVVHSGKIFIFNDYNPEVYDPRNNSWSTWPKPVIPIGYGPCLISWKDSILQFGGNVIKPIVQLFNLTINAWSVLYEGSSPFNMYEPSCTLLPTEKVLVVGSFSNRNAVALYDIDSNSWELLQNTKYNRFGAAFVNLNGRIFLIGGGWPDTTIDVVEEFHYESNTWTEVEASPINQQMFSSALTLPAEMFAHLPGGCEGIE